MEKRGGNGLRHMTQIEEWREVARVCSPEDEHGRRGSQALRQACDRIVALQAVADAAQRFYDLGLREQSFATAEAIKRRNVLAQAIAALDLAP